MASEMASVPSHHLPSHTYGDLRSERRARNRDRKHREKYGNFRSPWPCHVLAPKPNDLPSSSSQQSHYIPICPDSCTHPDTAPCWMRTFPADLSTAPIVKFTKREAYEEATWAQPTSYKRSVPQRKEWPKWQRRIQSKKSTRREIRDSDGCHDIWGFSGEGFDMTYFDDKSMPWDVIPWRLFNEDLLVGSNRDDYRDTDDLFSYSPDGKAFPDHVPWHRYDDGWFRMDAYCEEGVCICDIQRWEPLYFPGYAPWHRHPVHGWFRMAVECEEGVCACIPELEEPLFYEALDKETFYAYADEGDHDALPEVDEGYISQGLEEQDVEDDGWDMVSNAPSTAWSEIDLL